jgi:hypothetical protein
MWYYGAEEAFTFTLIPNLLITGILAMTMQVVEAPFRES